MSVPATTVMNVPAHIAARIASRKAEGAKSELLSAVVTGDGFPYPRISIRAGRYRLVEDGVETVVGTEMDVIIVGVNPHVSKIFYGRPYDPNATDMRPDCFSNDGIKPDASVVNPVFNNCSNCPHNVLGSKVTPTGAKSKLCSDQRHLAVVPAADPTKVYSLTVPVSGMKGLREYFKWMQNFQIVPNDVVTKLSFDDSTSYPKIIFTQKGFVPNEATGKLDSIVASGEVKEITRAVPVGTFNKALAAPVVAPALVSPVADNNTVIAETGAAAAVTVDAPAPAVDEAYAADDEGGVNTVAPSSELDAALANIFK